LKENIRQFEFQIHKEKEMADFRKWMYAFAVLMLALSVGTADAQVSTVNCVANSGVPPLLRAEGYAELVGDVVIVCTAPTGTPSQNVNFDIFLNTNVTSDLVTGGSEGLILINEPAPATQVMGGNVFQGQRTTGFENRLTWNNIPFAPYGTPVPGITPGTVIYRITNVRANATQLPSGQFIPSSVSMFINISPQNALPLSNPQQIVGSILPSLRFDLTSVNFRQCEPPSDSTGIINATFTELFASAFKKRIETAGDGQRVPGLVYGTESGLTPRSLDPGDIGVADTGTRFLLRIGAIPAGASVSAPPTVGVVGTSLTLQRITGWDANFAGGTDATTALAVSGAGAAVLYEVRGAPGVTGINQIDAFSIPLTVTYPLTVALGSATISGNYAPINATQVMSSPAPEPRFRDDAVDRAFFTINPCRTLLLFPFVTNQGGFDTGLAISNTSQDPFGTTPQAGGCTLYFYGNSNGTGAAPNPAAITSIAGGGHFVGILSTGGTNGFTGAPGFQGYIIAVCAFQYAHGYAFISDVGASDLAQGYLALIIPDKQTPVRRPEAFSLNQGPNQGEQLVH
jgi:hypothetical protein